MTNINFDEPSNGAVNGNNRPNMIKVVQVSSEKARTGLTLQDSESIFFSLSGLILPLPLFSVSISFHCQEIILQSYKILNK
jgi:hypothetical protein